MAREPHRSSEILDAVALLVVDMQDALLNVTPDRETVLRRTALAIEAARAFGIKVIFTEQAPAKLGPVNADLLALAPDARVFAKNEFSALLAEGLQEYLRRINVYHLLLAGVETPICIYQTALHAQDNDLDVTLLSDCTTGRRPDDCLVVLESLARAECHVLPAETVFYSMLGSSANPRFAHFTRIVKRYAGDGPIGGGPTPAPEVEARPEGEERQPGQRHGERHDHGRHGERHHGTRHGERQPPRQGHADASGETPAESDEPSDDLRAEDGISEAEANQPSYEEATAEHSEVESAPEESRQRETRSAPAAESPDAEADDDGESQADDEPAEGETSAEGGDAGPKKKRGRRRRGGARRRRARERAAANGQPGGDNAAGESGSSGPAESSAPSPGSETPASD